MLAPFALSRPGAEATGRIEERATLDRNAIQPSIRGLQPLLRTNGANI